MHVMNISLYLLALITLVSAIAGGLLAKKLQTILQYFFAFSSGTLLAITFFTVLPKSWAIADSIDFSQRTLMIATVVTFLLFSLMERFFLTHHHHEEEKHGHIMGPGGAIALVVHSLLDGAAIGVAFHVNSAMGVIVAVAVICHIFTDGANVIVTMTANVQNVKKAKAYLVIDALAPVIGVLIAGLLTINQSYLSVLLAAFAGQFLFLGADNLLQGAHHHNTWKMVTSMISGILLLTSS
jgi:ZIP family zinc transporter